MFNYRFYLDFDGVVNAEAPEHDVVSKFVIPIEGSQYLSAENHITFSPTVVHMLDSFRVEHNIELVWLTTWNDREDVLKLSDYLNGLHGGRVVAPNLIDTWDKKEWTQWKADAIIADQKESPTPFVWVDDNAHQYHAETVISSIQTIPHLIVTTNSVTGLTITDLDKMREFFETA
jgi:hypothetical protein